MGPTLLGAILPHVEATLFPISALPTLQTLGDIGLMVISPTFFAMLVIMAVMTTVMTPPLLHLLGYRQKTMREQEVQEVLELPENTVVSDL